MCDVSDLIGLPWSNKGRGPESYDCWGLSMEVLRRFGVALPDYDVDAAARHAIDGTYSALLGPAEAGAGPWLPLNNQEPGAVVAIRNHPKYVSHMGVYLDRGLFIHVMRDIRVSIERVNAIEWRNKIVGYYRYVG